MVDRYFCVRVYANGQMKCSMRDQAGYESWLNYNKVYRFGNGLFVNGLCVAPGYLDSRQVAQVEAELAVRGIPHNEPPVQIGPQVQVIGVFSGLKERYVGYPEDYEVSPITWKD